MLNRFQCSLGAIFVATFLAAVVFACPILLLPEGAALGYLTQLRHGQKRRLIGAGIGFVVACGLLLLSLMGWIAFNGVAPVPA